MTEDFKYSFVTSKTPNEVYEMLLDIKKWWFGIYDETISGKSDEFSFKAGGGAHYSKQKLIELAPDKKLVWQVTDSKLSFLDDTREWNDTTIGFDIDGIGSKTKVTMTHTGLTPELECYDSCSGAWKQYMERFERVLKN